MILGFGLSTDPGPEAPDRITRTTEPAAADSGSSTVDPYIDSTARGTGASTPPPQYATDPGLRRFVRRGLRADTVGPLWYGLGRRMQQAARPTGQRGLNSTAVTLAASSPNERRAPALERTIIAEQTPWYESYVTG